MTVPDEEEVVATPAQNPPQQPASEPQQMEGEDSYGLSDHRTYSQYLYEQPSWIIDAVWAANNLDPNGQYPKGHISTLINQMMGQTDNRYVEETP